MLNCTCSLSPQIITGMPAWMARMAYWGKWAHSPRLWTTTARTWMPTRASGSLPSLPSLFQMEMEVSFLAPGSRARAVTTSADSTTDTTSGGVARARRSLAYLSSFHSLVSLSMAHGAWSSSPVSCMVPVLGYFRSEGATCTFRVALRWALVPTGERAGAQREGMQ